MYANDSDTEKQYQCTRMSAKLCEHSMVLQRQPSKKGGQSPDGLLRADIVAQSSPYTCPSFMLRLCKLTCAAVGTSTALCRRQMCDQSTTATAYDHTVVDP